MKAKELLQDFVDLYNEALDTGYAVEEDAESLAVRTRVDGYTVAMRLLRDFIVFEAERVSKKNPGLAIDLKSTKELLIEGWNE